MSAASGAAQTAGATVRRYCSTSLVSQRQSQYVLTASFLRSRHLGAQSLGMAPVAKRASLPSTSVFLSSRNEARTGVAPHLHRIAMGIYQSSSSISVVSSSIEARETVLGISDLGVGLMEAPVSAPGQLSPHPRVGCRDRQCALRAEQTDQRGSRGNAVSTI